MGDKSRNRVHYYVLCTEAFAEQKSIAPQKAFNYLKKYKGIDFLIDCYDAEHTLSLNDAA